MTPELEWLTGVLRLGRDYRRHGDPYEFSCTVLRRGDEVELLGASGGLSPSLARRMKEVFLVQGVRRLSWERRNGKVRRVVWDMDWNTNGTVSISHEDAGLMVIASAEPDSRPKRSRRAA
jgi:hypothetical protein